MREWVVRRQELGLLRVFWLESWGFGDKDGRGTLRAVKKSWLWYANCQQRVLSGRTARRPRLANDVEVAGYSK